MAGKFKSSMKGKMKRMGPDLEAHATMPSKSARSQGGRGQGKSKLMGPDLSKHATQRGK